MPGLDAAKLIASVAGAVVRPNPLAMITIEGPTCSQYELEAEIVAATRNPRAISARPPATTLSVPTRFTSRGAIEAARAPATANGRVCRPALNEPITRASLPTGWRGVAVRAGLAVLRASLNVNPWPMVWVIRRQFADTGKPPCGVAASAGAGRRVPGHR